MYLIICIPEIVFHIDMYRFILKCKRGFVSKTLESRYDGTVFACDLAMKKIILYK